jgi:hypothetical protein
LSDDGANLDPAMLSTQSPHEFFRELLLAAIAHQRASVHDETRAYLVNLLSGFIESEAFFSRDESGALEQRPLAFLLKDALDEEGPLRLARLRRLGDLSLFVSGFWPESLDRGVVSVDYYISMGERAYDALGGAVAKRVRGAGDLVRQRSVFEELARKFKQLVDLLNEVSERTWLATNAGAARLCDRVLSTGSMRLASLLRSQGVLVPIPIVVRGGRAS